MFLAFLPTRDVHPQRFASQMYMKQMMTLCGLAPKLGRALSTASVCLRAHLTPVSALPAFMHIAAKFNNLALQPEDVAFCMYSSRQKDDETSGDITLLEQVEAGIAQVLRLLTF